MRRKQWKARSEAREEEEEEGERRGLERLRPGFKRAGAALLRPRSIRWAAVLRPTLVREPCARRLMTRGAWMWRSHPLPAPADLNLNWAVSNVAAFVTHSSQGGATLNVQTGSVAEVRPPCPRLQGSVARGT